MPRTTTIKKAEREGDLGHIGTPIYRKDSRGEGGVSQNGENLLKRRRKPTVKKNIT